MSLKPMSDLVREKKLLAKQLITAPERKAEIELKMAEIDRKLISRVNKSDQNFLRVFYKIAKESLEPSVLTHLEGVASTRRHNYQSSNP